MKAIRMVMYFFWWINYQSYFYRYLGHHGQVYLNESRGADYDLHEELYETYKQERETLKSNYKKIKSSKWESYVINGVKE